MSLTHVELCEITGQASTLSERCSGKFEPVEDDGSMGRCRLERWRKLAAGGQPDAFRHALRARGLEQVSETVLLQLLGTVRLAPGETLPDWAAWLRNISLAVAAHFTDSGSCDSRSRYPGNQIPFGHLYWPVARFAWSQVTENFPPAETLLTSAARKALWLHLVARLSRTCSAALQLSFLAHRSIHDSGMFAHFFGEASGGARKPNDAIYLKFVQQQGKTGLRSFFTLYPAAARLLAQLTRDWSVFVEEFLPRFEGDRQMLGEVFNAGLPLAKIKSIKAGIADAHRGGRSVLILTFGDDLRIVYKPRPMGIDRMYFDLVSELNSCQPSIDLRAMKVVDRGEYGWMEFARHAACSSEDAATRYYRRAGSLVCLLHWLQAVDCHRENLVAAGEHPVLVDLEALAHTLMPEELVADEGRLETVAGSALRTGLLPLWQKSPFGPHWYDNGGLDAQIIRQDLYATPWWRNVNLDAMESDARITSRVRHEHRPKLGKQPLSMKDYEDDVLLGYRETSTLLEGERAEQFARWREAAHRTTRRRIKRPTALYAILIGRSLQPEHLSSGVDRSIELETLPLGGDADEDRSTEISSLEGLDIPYFQFKEQSADGQTPACVPQPKNTLLGQEKTIRLSIRRQLSLSNGLIRERMNRRDD